MCLAIPCQITEMDDFHRGSVEVLGLTQKASFELTPTAQVGDWVLLHAGFSIEVVDEQYAKETIDLVMSIPGYADELLGDDAAAVRNAYYSWNASAPDGGGDASTDEQTEA
jgi:hydrogenase expression/formation protein HypC